MSDIPPLIWALVIGSCVVLSLICLVAAYNRRQAEKKRQATIKWLEQNRTRRASEAVLYPTSEGDLEVTIIGIMSGDRVKIIWNEYDPEEGYVKGFEGVVPISMLIIPDKTTK